LLLASSILPRNGSGVLIGERTNDYERRESPSLLQNSRKQTVAVERDPPKP
jgi:hypothetical protein